MKTKRRFGVGVYAGAALLAAGASIGLWRAGALADLNLSDAIRVEIGVPSAIDITLYTPDGDIPATLPIGIWTEVGPEPARAATIDDIASVVTALGGDLDTGTGTITGELAKDTAFLVNESGGVGDYLSVIDLAKMDFSGARGATKVANDVIRTVAVASTYYATRSVANVAEGDSINVTMTVGDAADVDDDGNGLPNATALLGGTFIVINRNRVITIVTPIDSRARGAATTVEVTHTYDTADGPVEVTVEAPTLAALQIADDAFDVYDTAQLLVSIAGDSADLVDQPSTADPEAEFDLVDGTDALPAPKNLFVRVAIAVATTSTRGAVQSWDFVDDLPGGLDYVATLSGPGIADRLQNGTDVDAYTYGLTLSQSGEDIIVNAGNDAQTDPWAEADGGVTVNNEDNADDAADSRSIVNAEDGDDTIRATFSIGSAILGSNVTPKASTSGGGSDGSGWFCFVATAAYGTPMANQIGTLRSVRDQYLVTNALGAAFVDAYYHISPPFAGLIAQNDTARMIARAVLTPVVVASRWFVMAPAATSALAIALMILGIGLGKRVFRPARTPMLRKARQ